MEEYPPIINKPWFINPGLTSIVSPLYHHPVHQAWGSCLIIPVGAYPMSQTPKLGIVYGGLVFFSSLHPHKDPTKKTRKIIGFTLLTPNKIPYKSSIPLIIRVISWNPQEKINKHLDHFGSHQFPFSFSQLSFAPSGVANVVPVDRLPEERGASARAAVQDGREEPIRDRQLTSETFASPGGAAETPGGGSGWIRWNGDFHGIPQVNSAKISRSHWVLWPFWGR